MAEPILRHGVMIDLRVFVPILRAGDELIENQPQIARLVEQSSMMLQAHRIGLTVKQSLVEERYIFFARHF